MQGSRTKYSRKKVAGQNVAIKVARTKYSSLNICGDKMVWKNGANNMLLASFQYTRYTGINFVLLLSISAFNSSSLSRHFVRNILSNDILSWQHFSRYICPRHFELNILSRNI
jgi:hypothetical protein